MTKLINKIQIVFGLCVTLALTAKPVETLVGRRINSSCRQVLSYVSHGIDMTIRGFDVKNPLRCITNFGMGIRV